MLALPIHGRLSTVATSRFFVKRFIIVEGDTVHFQPVLELYQVLTLLIQRVVDGECYASQDTRSRSEI